MIGPVGTPGVRGLALRPNTGTGVKLPGGPAAVMAEGRFRKLGTWPPGFFAATGYWNLGR